MSTLLLKFDAPMQSWGTELKLKHHPTDRYPSKSGVIGVIASAFGRRRDADISDLAALKFGVRIDEQGTIIRDFQVSKVKDDEDGKIGYREYLSDAVFTCGIEGDDKMLHDIKNALLHPAYPLFAGRRGCPVTAELVQNILPDGLLQSLMDEEDTEKTIIIDTDDTDGTAVKDVPVSFSPNNRQYRYRFIKIV